MRAVPLTNSHAQHRLYASGVDSVHYVKGGHWLLVEWIIGCKPVFRFCSNPFTSLYLQTIGRAKRLPKEEE